MKQIVGETAAVIFIAGGASLGALGVANFVNQPDGPFTYDTYPTLAGLITNDCLSGTDTTYEDPDNDQRVVCVVNSKPDSDIKFVTVERYNEGPVAFYTNRLGAAVGRGQEAVAEFAGMQLEVVSGALATGSGLVGLYSLWRRRNDEPYLPASLQPEATADQPPAQE